MVDFLPCAAGTRAAPFLLQKSTVKRGRSKLEHVVGCIGLNCLRKSSSIISCGWLELVPADMRSDMLGDYVFPLTRVLPFTPPVLVWEIWY